MTDKRILAFDIAKGIAILLVVWMHCLQYGYGETFNNHLYAFVYTFHMPLFLIISGYLYSKRLGCNVKKNIFKQFKRLLIPNIIWGVLLGIILSQINLMSILNSFWFLYTLFVVIILYEIAYLLFSNLILSTIVLSISILLFPGMEFIKFSVPFFGIGLIIGNLSLESYRYGWKPIICLAVIGILSYILLWNGQEYIYITKSPNFFNLNMQSFLAYFLRIFTGSLIAISVILFFHMIGEGVKNKLIISFSKNSLGIYITHLFLLLLIVQFTNITQSRILTQTSKFSELVTCIVSIVIVFILNKIITSCKNNNYLKHIL